MKMVWNEQHHVFVWFGEFGLIMWCQGWMEMVSGEVRQASTRFLMRKWFSLVIEKKKDRRQLLFYIKCEGMRCDILFLFFHFLKDSYLICSCQHSRKFYSHPKLIHIYRMRGILDVCIFCVFKFRVNLLCIRIFHNKMSFKVTEHG